MGSICCQGSTVAAISFRVPWPVMDVVVGSAARVITAWVFAGAGWIRRVPVILPFRVLAPLENIPHIVDEVTDAIPVGLVHLP